MINDLVGDPSKASVKRAQLHLALAAVSYIGGDLNTAQAEAEAVLAQTGLPANLYVAAKLHRLEAVLADGDTNVPVAQRLAEWRGICDRGPDGEAVVAQAALAWRAGRVGETLGLLWAAHHAGVASAGADEHPALALSTVLTALGQWEEAQECVLIAADEVALTGNSLWAAAPALFSARVHLAAGRLDEATTVARTGLHLIEELGTSMLAPIGLDVLLAAALMRGELSAANEQLALWQIDPLLRLPFGSPHRYWSSLRVREAQGMCLPGDSTTEVLFDLAARDRRLLLEEPAAGAWLVRVAQRAGDPKRSELVEHSVRQLAACNPGVSSVIAAAAHTRGLAHRDLASLSMAATEHRSPWARASAAEDAAKLSAHQGDRGGARTWLEQANVDYQRCGAARDGARIRSRLRATGVRPHHWNRQERPLWGWDSLTETEHTVARLVTEGLSNRQIGSRMYLSRNTVDFHLRNMFRKLGIDSRVVLTRMTLESGR